jgi:hypothetical protein
MGQPWVSLLPISETGSVLGQSWNARDFAWLISSSFLLSCGGGEMYSICAGAAGGSKALREEYVAAVLWYGSTQIVRRGQKIP